MSKITRTFETEATVPVECEGKYYSGSSATFNQVFGNYLPGDSEDVSNFKVFINIHGNRLDISNCLTSKEKSSLLAAFIEECREEESA